MMENRNPWNGEVIPEPIEIPEDAPRYIWNGELIPQATEKPKAELW